MTPSSACSNSLAARPNAAAIAAGLGMGLRPTSIDELNDAVRYRPDELSSGHPTRHSRTTASSPNTSDPRVDTPAALAPRPVAGTSARQCGPVVSELGRAAPRWRERDECRRKHWVGLLRASTCAFDAARPSVHLLAVKPSQAGLLLTACPQAGTLVANAVAVESEAALAHAYSRAFGGVSWPTQHYSANRWGALTGWRPQPPSPSGR